MTDQNTTDFDELVRTYAQVLQDLFDVTRYYDIDRLFEFVCALVRSAGLQDAGWDPYYESEAVLEDLRNLSGLDLPMDKFSDPDRTRMRLALLSYCHLIEMDLPYDVIANLLRLKLGMKYQMHPFGDLAQQVGKKKTGAVLQKYRPPSPRMKIKRIRELADGAKMPEIADAFDSIYYSTFFYFAHATNILKKAASYELLANVVFFLLDTSIENLETFLDEVGDIYYELSGHRAPVGKPRVESETVKRIAAYRNTFAHNPVIGRAVGQGLEKLPAYEVLNDVKRILAGSREADRRSAL